MSETATRVRKHPPSFLLDYCSSDMLGCDGPRGERFGRLYTPFPLLQSAPPAVDGLHAGPRGGGHCGGPAGGLGREAPDPRPGPSMGPVATVLGRCLLP